MFQPQLGLKGSSSREQIDDRLRYQPQVYEFFTAANDFTPEGYQHLREAIQYVQSRGVRHTVLHHPMSFGEYHADVVAPVARDEHAGEQIGERRDATVSLRKRPRSCSASLMTWTSKCWFTVATLAQPSSTWWHCTRPSKQPGTPFTSGWTVLPGQAVTTLCLKTRLHQYLRTVTPLRKTKSWPTITG